MKEKTFVVSRKQFYRYVQFEVIDELTPALLKLLSHPADKEES